MNNLSNVTLWFAKDESGKTITIDKIDNECEGKYICPLCGSEVIPKAIESEFVSPHFAHIDKSKCCGETMVHWWVKNELIKIGDEFIVNTDKENKFICEEIEIEKEYITTIGGYKPDITIKTKCGKIIFVEINVSNKKDVNDYLDMWKELNNIVAEFNVKDVIEQDGVIKINNNFKAIYYKGKVFIDKNSSEYKKYRMSINSSIKNSEALYDIEWFIDDIYKYTKGVITIDELELGYDEAVRVSKDIVESLYRNNKCSRAIKDILFYRDKILKNTRNKISNEFGIEVECTCNSSERLITKRLFNSSYIKIKQLEILNKIIEDKDISEIIEYLNGFGLKPTCNKWGKSNIEIRSFNDLSPYCVVKEEILKTENELTENIETLVKIYNHINRGNYMYAKNTMFCWNYDNRIKDFVLEKLKDSGIIEQDTTVDWKHTDKSTDDIVMNIIHNDYSFFKSGVEYIYGEPFINLESDDMENDIDDIGRKVLKLKEEYDYVYERCEYIKSIMEVYAYSNYSIKICTEKDNLNLINIKSGLLNCTIYRNGIIKIDNLNICKTNIDNLDLFINDFEFSINYTVNHGSYLFSRKTIEIYSKLLNRYTKETSQEYKIEVDRTFFTISNNKYKEISKFRYFDDTIFEEVVDKFSKDIRKCLYSEKEV